jgi:hypothetical protein
MTGAKSLIDTIVRREDKIKTGVYLATLKTLTEIDAESKGLTPKDTGLLRANTKIAINTDWLGKYIPAKSNIIAKTGLQRRAKVKIKNTASVSGVNTFLADIRGRTRGVVYNNMPYANVRDLKGGLVKPPGFLSSLRNKYARKYRMRIRAVVNGAGRA